MRAAVAAALALPLALAACFGGGTVTVTVPCPVQLVSVEEADPSERPAAPVRMRDRLPDLYVYTAALGLYVDALELQARAREEQVADCRELAAE